ncbi:MAG: MoxR family ATPase [Firmicutes bacterium]|nr:MoxR family ATPase [Bacillota bacterium]
MRNEIQQVIDEIQKVIVGKQAALIKLLIALLADGHILLDDVPGVGKTTLAMAASKAMGLSYRRIQFTPDVLPSDITGFSVYNKETGSLTYMPGAVNDANILLGDEINRTSSKTQSALLEAMEERQVTVDGVTHPLLSPFIVIATQNNVGTAGTQLLPFAQLDRFLMRLSIGYPDFESQMAIIRDRQKSNPITNVRQVLSLKDVLRMQDEVQNVTMKDSVIAYIAQIAEKSREDSRIELGISPRGALFVAKAAKGRAYALGRDYVIPEDVREVLADVCAHRIILAQQARAGKVAVEEVVQSLIEAVKMPDGQGRAEK